MSLVKCQECGEVMAGEKCIQHIKDKHPDKIIQEICWELMMKETGKCSGEDN